MNSLDDAGKLVLRLSLGILILLHGFAKLTGGIGGIEAMLMARGLPSWIAWAAYLGEILGPLLVILGAYARVGAVLIAVNMVFAIVLAHAAQVWTLNNNGGWGIELQGMFLLAAVAVALLGAGRYSVAGRNGTLN